MASLLASRYAAAVFAVAEAHGAVDAVAGDLTRLSSALADPAIRAALLHPRTPAARRADLLERAMTGCHEVTASALRAIVRRRREAVLPELAAAFDERVRARRGEALATVETARPLAEAELHELRRLLGDVTGQSVTLTVKENTDLLGGVRVRVGNTLYDGSLASRLTALRKRLLEAPLP
jgi:F-type H+-transporting ATPase subunit delta